MVYEIILTVIMYTYCDQYLVLFLFAKKYLLMFLSLHLDFSLYTMNVYIYYTQNERRYYLEFAQVYQQRGK